MSGKLFVPPFLFPDRAADGEFLDDSFCFFGGVHQSFAGGWVLTKVEFQLASIFHSLTAPSKQPRQQPFHSEFQFGVLLRQLLTKILQLTNRAGLLQCQCVLAA